MNTVRRITLPLSEFEPLAQEARGEGYGFVDLTLRDWGAGRDCFDGPGGLFCGSFEGAVLVAIGGLSRDPYLNDPQVGRLRRIYVRAAWRRLGVGMQVVEFLLAEAKKSFRVVRLRAENEGAARLYERLGFCPVMDPDASHTLRFPMTKRARNDRV